VSVDVKSYFNDLTNELEATYPSISQNLNVNLQIEIKQLNLNTLVPLALLYNELFSNSIKHAFINVTNGEINVKLNQSGSNKLEFQYCDNGLWQNAPNETSFGLEMIDTFTEQLDGKFERILKNGTTYKFDLSILE
jgi:two-component sensor histidine kinase